jgi:hypothetical protein
MQASTGFSDTRANLTAQNPTLPANWSATETDTGRSKQGDGVTAWASLPYTGGGGVTIQKTATETRTSTSTLANDASLLFTMAASTNYFIQIRLWFDTTAAADFKFALTGPASPTLVRLFRRAIDPTNLTTLVVASEVAYTASTALAAGTGTTGGYIDFEINVQNGVTAGVFAFQWSQNTLDASNTSVLLGSYLTYRIVS